MTKAQEKLFDQIKSRLSEVKDPNYLRNQYELYYKNFYETFESFESCNSNDSVVPFIKEMQKKAIEENIVSVRANSKTLKGLESLGLIKILEIGGSFHDYVKVL